MQLGKTSSVFAGNEEELEAKFNEILQQARDAYCPVIESYGVGCAINGDWQDSTVNAFAMKSK